MPWPQVIKEYCMNKVMYSPLPCIIYFEDYKDNESFKIWANIRIACKTYPFVRCYEVRYGRYLKYIKKLPKYSLHEVLVFKLGNIMMSKNKPDINEILYMFSWVYARYCLEDYDIYIKLTENESENLQSTQTDCNGSLDFMNNTTVSIDSQSNLQISNSQLTHLHQLAHYLRVNKIFKMSPINNYSLNNSFINQKDQCKSPTIPIATSRVIPKGSKNQKRKSKSLPEINIKIPKINRSNSFSFA